MCTVTYLPTTNGFVLTSNRDEALVRKPAKLTVIENIESHRILFLRDGEARGTWIATSENERTICLLNRAFVRHQHQPHYRKSRGLVVLDFFKTASAENFYDSYDLEGIELFTLLIIESKQLFEFKWDGQ